MMSSPPGRSALLLAAALGCAAPAGAQEPVEPPAPVPPTAPAPAGEPAGAQRVEITGGRASDTEQRRQSTAAKIVIGREEIDKFGDATVGEVLRRLPGVTTPGAPGRGGPPRMRGLGSGYTQLLIDGQRIPAGFSLESLAPDQIERIEILRAPTAETGARAIAGTINIIMREGYRRRLNDLRLGLALENGELSPSAHWNFNDNAGPLTYTLAASTFRNQRAFESRTETIDEELATGALTREQTETVQTQETRRGLTLSSRLQWRLGEADTLLLTPWLVASESDSARRFRLEQALGSTPPLYDWGDSDTNGRYTAARLDSQWRTRLGGGTRLEVNAGFGRWSADSESLRQEFANGDPVPLRTIEDTGSTRENTQRLIAKLSSLLGGDVDGTGAHSLVSGVELERRRRDETRLSLQDGVPQLTEFGENLSASSQRLAAYAQDEWSINPNWAAHAGLRWEGIHTRGDAGDGTSPENRSSVWTPLLHAVWKPDPKGRDQVRVSLTRSYRSPPLGNLIARPAISGRYPVQGPNTPTSPDRAGNPDLEPELATGIDLAFEHYLDGGGVLSANLFQRRIKDLMRSVTSLETVSWSPVPRWVARQQNVGDATTRGLELDARFRLDQAVEGAPAVELRANLGVYRSEVDDVPGPDNRLDSQAPATFNLGADYRLRGLPLTLGGNLNWLPGYRTQVDETQATTVSSKHVYDAYALWTFNPTLALRLTASNLAPADYLNTNTVDGDTQRETARTLTASYTNWQLRLEMKL